MTQPTDPVPAPDARLKAAATPCSVPECNADQTGEPCDRHETEQAHAAGDHQFCGLECSVTLPSEQLRSAVLCQAIPGSPAMLAELERRAAVVPVPLLSDRDRLFLSFALGLAFDRMCSRGDEFGDDDHAALTALRKLAGGEA